MASPAVDLAQDLGPGSFVGRFSGPPAQAYSLTPAERSAAGVCVAPLQPLADMPALPPALLDMEAAFLEDVSRAQSGLEASLLRVAYLQLAGRAWSSIAAAAAPHSPAQAAEGGARHRPARWAGQARSAVRSTRRLLDKACGSAAAELLGALNGYNTRPGLDWDALSPRLVGWGVLVLSSMGCCTPWGTACYRTQHPLLPQLTLQQYAAAVCSMPPLCADDISSYWNDVIALQLHNYPVVTVAEVATVLAGAAGLERLLCARTGLAKAMAAQAAQLGLISDNVAAAAAADRPRALATAVQLQARFALHATRLLRRHAPLVHALVGALAAPTSAHALEVLGMLLPDVGSTACSVLQDDMPPGGWGGGHSRPVALGHEWDGDSGAGCTPSLPCPERRQQREQLAGSGGRTSPLPPCLEGVRPATPRGVRRPAWWRRVAGVIVPWVRPHG